MIDLSTISAELQLSPEQLRVAAELLSQGYQPPFICNFRADESGNLPEQTLWRLKAAMEKHTALSASQQNALTELANAANAPSGLEQALRDSRSTREIERLLRPLHSKKNSHTFTERHPQAAAILSRLQQESAPKPEAMADWLVSNFGIEASQVEAVLGQVRHLLVLKLSENPGLISKLRRQISRKAVLVAELLKETSAAAASQPAVSVAESSAASIAAAVAAEQHEEQQALSPSAAEDLGEEIDALTEEEQLQDHDAEGADETADSNVAGESVAADTSETVTSESTSSEAAGAQAKPTAGEKSKKGKGESRLTPRQRRRRWLQSMLQPLDGMKKPLNKLTAYQTVMLARGQRTQLIKTNLEYDRAGLVLMATESLVPPNHPLTSWMDEVASEALGRVILPRLEQDILAELEKQAHDRLTNQAGDHFASFVTQRPLRGHRILCVDAVGPKMAPLAIINHRGEVLAIDEIPCQSGKSENKTAVVTKLGELVHKHRVSLIVLSNGPARRSIMPAIAELLDQSTPGSVRFTLIDRTGADAYASTKLSAEEMGRFSRRHRSAIWLGRRLQDSQREILKIDLARLRLGSYQGELETNKLRQTLNDVVSATMASDGIDVWHASEGALQRIPGVTPEVATAIVKLRQEGRLTSRAQLLESLGNIWSPANSRQAIGFLRIYNSPQPLDGTVIHPDDYHLATRLAGSLNLALPPAHPEGWVAPKLASVETQTDSPASVTAESTEGQASEASQAAIAPESADVASASATSEESADQAVSGQEAESDSSGSAASEVPSGDASSAEPVAQEETATGGGTSEEPQDVVTPEVETTAATAPQLLDVEKFAKSWQVGREKLKRIASALQSPFADRRLANPMIPLWTKVPKIDDLQPGMTLWGVIVGLADFGAFADLGVDCQGLIHVSRLAPGYVEDPHQFVQIGDLVQVWVVSVDREKKRISLSAIPPGQESPPPKPNRGGSEGERRGGAGRGPTGGSGNRGGRGPGQGSENRGSDSRGGDNRGGRPGRDGGRDGGNRGGGFRGDSGRGGGQQGRGRGFGGRNKRHEDHSRDEETTVLNPRPVVERPAKAAPILTEGMQKGREPLRSFADLMQFYQTQKDPSSPPSSTEANSKNNETTNTNTDSTDV